MQAVNINAQTRELSKKKGTKALREAGLVPAVIYGGNSTEHVSVVSGDMRPLIFTPDFKVAELSIDGKIERCIVKDMQFHPVSDELVHIDFLRIVDGHPIKVKLPLHFEGTPVGVRNGGKLIKEARKLEVRLLPENLVDHLVIDVTDLKMGESARVRDVEVEEGVEILVDGAIPVAAVEIPRALKSAQAKGDGEAGDDEEGDEA